MNKFMLGGAVTAVTFIAAAALAQPVPPPAPAPEPQMQIQRDERVERQPMRVHTRDDVVKHVRDLFVRLDTNRDGFITREEADVGKEAMGRDMREHFADRLAERDGPGPDRGAAFDRLDTNKDGAISREEFISAKPRFEERRMIVMHGGPDGEPAAPGEPGPMGMGKGMGMRMGMGMGMGMGLHGPLFEMADANHDGKVSLQEATDAAVRHFDIADANHDGKLTPDEHMQMRQKIRIERHPA